MGTPLVPRSRTPALMAVIVTLLGALPAGSALAALEDAAVEALAEDRALVELERLHALPETIEYVCWIDLGITLDVTADVQAERQDRSIVLE